MTPPVQVIKVERIKLKSGIKTYRVFVDKRELQEHLLDALAVAAGRRLSWPDHKHVIIDGLKLLESGKKPGRYAIFNCTCGSGAACAGLEDTIDVAHEGDLIRWRYKAPRPGLETDRVFAFAFHKPQYLKALTAIEPINDLKDLPGYGAYPA